MGEPAPVDEEDWNEKTGPDLPVGAAPEASLSAAEHDELLFGATPFDYGGEEALPRNLPHDLPHDLPDSVTPPAKAPQDVATPAAMLNGLGGAGDGEQPVDFDAMLASSTASFPAPDAGHAFVPAPAGSSHSIDKMIEPGSVLALRAGVEIAGLGLAPFEQHVVSFIDGDRTVARIGKKAGLGIADLKIAIGMLADRNLLFVRGHVRPSLRSMLGDVDLDQSSDDLQLPLPPGPEASRAAANTVFDLPLDALSALGGDRSDQESVFGGDDGAPAPVRAAIRTATSGNAARGESPIAATPLAPPDPAPAAVAISTGPQVDPAKRAQALQVLELGLSDLRTGKKPRALGYIKMAADLDPTNEMVQALLKDWGKAEKLALGAVPESEDQRLAAEGQKALAEGQIDRAIELYRKAIALSPLEPEFRNLLGIALALHVRDFTAAASEFMKACELAPTNLAYRSNLQRTFKIAEGGAPTGMHAGKDSDLIRDAARAAAKKPAGLLDKLRGGKK